MESKDKSDFFKRSATSIGVDYELSRIIEQEFSDSQREQATRLFRVFENPFLNLLLNARFTKFSKLDPASREKYLFNLASSTLALKRSAFQALKRLVIFTYYGFTPLGQSTNPNWEEIGYARRETDGIVSSKIPTISPEKDQVFECDVCVIGSGAGGSIISEHLSSAGWKVVVVEAGEYLASQEYSGQEYEMTRRLFEQRGRAATSDLSISLLEGSVGGGGTTVNWNTSIKPESWLLNEWGREGISELSSSKFDSCVSFVWEKLRVNKEESQLNPNNDVLFRGCKELGYKMPEDYDIIWRNAVGCKERCAYCSYGCQYACKQSTVAALIPESAASGCKFIFNANARTILMKEGKTSGVECIFNGKVNFQVKSRVVVVAAGSINTPAILFRSGLRKNVGYNLLLHPTTAVSGRFENPIKMWEGPPQTCKVTKGRNLDGKHHGYWLEAVPAHPGLFGSAIPWTGGRAHKELMVDMAHVCGTIVLVRESGSGRVKVDKRGNPICEYKLNSQDKASMMAGMLEAARILISAGAKKLYTLYWDGLEIESNSKTLGKSELDRFDAEVRKRGIIPNRISLFSAHIMGSARMGSEAISFCNDDAESYEASNLFIGDASVFPSSPGVNPMITIMSMAKRNAEKIDSILRSR